MHTASLLLSTVSGVTDSPPKSLWPVHRGIGPLGRALGRRYRAIIITVAILLVLVIVASEVRLPYYAMSPGQAVPVESMIKAPKSVAVHRSHGSVLMTDVYVTPVRLIDLPSYWLSSDTALLPSQDLLGGLSASEYEALSLSEMRHSQLQAEVAALRYLGYSVPGYSGAVIAKVLPDTPAAAAKLAPGQVITSINARPTPDDVALASVLGALRPGDVATLGIVDPSRSGSSGLGTSHAVTVRLGSRKLSSGRGNGPYLGVELSLSRQERFKLPLAVTIGAGNIGGPSAGLAFTLGIIDELTSGWLTAGRTVAATGTIRVNGTIGEVGGVAQKTVAVERGGASVFIVPAGELTQARSHSNGHLEVLGVTTLVQAVRDLMKLGGRLGSHAGRKFPPRPLPAS